MTSPVKRTVAKQRKKPRNRRVKSEKVDLKLTEALKTRFNDLCDKRNANRSAVLRDLIEAWCEAMESGRKPDAPYEIREKKKTKEAKPLTS